MSAKLPQPVQNLIDSFNRLPGIGPKMAARLTFHLLQKSDYDVSRFIDSLDGIRKGLQNCIQCGHISEGEVCSICSSANRNKGMMCVVEGSLDVIALEKTGIYSGYYHVLGGSLSPIDGIGPDQLRLAALKRRVQEILSEGTRLELVIATNPSLEGEATAQYIAQLLEDVSTEDLTITRIARGLPMGSDLEYADPSTLTRAIEGRKNIN